MSPSLSRPSLQLSTPLQLILNSAIVLIAKGRTVDEVAIRRLENIARGTGVREPFDVLCPHRSEQRLAPEFLAKSGAELVVTSLAVDSCALEVALARDACSSTG
jgi:hypothetical protein